MSSYTNEQKEFILGATGIYIKKFAEFKIARDMDLCDPETLDKWFDNLHKLLETLETIINQYWHDKEMVEQAAAMERDDK